MSVSHRVYFVAGLVGDVPTGVRPDTAAVINRCAVSYSTVPGTNVHGVRMVCDAVTRAPCTGQNATRNARRIGLVSIDAARSSPAINVTNARNVTGAAPADVGCATGLVAGAVPAADLATGFVSGLVPAGLGRFGLVVVVMVGVPNVSGFRRTGVRSSPDHV